MKLTKIIISVLCVATLLGGTYVIAADANTEDTTWTYLSSKKTAITSNRKKNTSGNVYCYGKTGDPSLYVTVYGNNSSQYGSEAVKCSKKVLLYKGTQYTIVNSVRSSDHMYAYARLKFNTITSTNNTNSGVWSPDATKDYTVVK